MNKRIGRVVAQIHPFVGDSAQIYESNIDPLSQITKAPIGPVEKLSHLPFHTSSQECSTGALTGCSELANTLLYTYFADNSKGRQTGSE